MSNNLDVSHLVLCVFRKASDSYETELRMYSLEQDKNVRKRE